MSPGASGTALPDPGRAEQDQQPKTKERKSRKPTTYPQKRSYTQRINDGSIFGEHGGSNFSALQQRDCKTALIVFNKNVAGFKSTVLDNVPKALKSHALYKTEAQQVREGEWRMTFGQIDDPNVRITVHVFAFNLHSAKPKKATPKKRQTGKSSLE